MRLRPIQLARQAGVSVQTVRRYEELRFIPPSEGSATGYRQYAARHLQALLTARTLIPGYGWQRTQEILARVHRGDVDGALALVDARHAELATGRLQAEETLVALRSVALDAGPSVARSREPLRIGEAARRVGVRVSTLRFWERQGVLSPIRAPENRYRLFGEQDLIQLQVVALLRQAGYGFVAIRSVLDELSGGEVAKAVSAV